MACLSTWFCIGPRYAVDEHNRMQEIRGVRISISSIKGRQNSEQYSESTSKTGVLSRSSFPMSFKYPKMNPKDTDPAVSLKNRILRGMVHRNDPAQIFFPNSGWDGLLKGNEVRATLSKCGVDPKSIPNLSDFILRKATKLFTILIIINKPDLITAFYENDIGQEELPVEQNRLEDIFGQDDLAMILELWHKQWWFTTPKFTRKQFKYDFHKLSHLPFTTPGSPIGASYYSTVEVRSIHVDHIELRPGQLLAKDESGNLRVAVKKLIHQDQALADKEAEVLEMMRLLQNDHLIETIAYYQQDCCHFFMFPWAEYGNLWEFWKNSSAAKLDRFYLVWVFKQLKGLAVALEQLHGQSPSQNSNSKSALYNCRHGDLKPENVLCFHDNGKDSSGGPAVRMVITDVGLAKNHKEATQLREATGTTVSTMRYAAPEMEVTPKASLSRRFDIWSMGCIMLEFVVWLLYGHNELLKCTDAICPTFYETKMDENTGINSAQVHPVVQKWVSYMRKDWRCSQGTALRRLLDLIINRLLAVDVADSAGSFHSSPRLGTESQLAHKAADLRIIEPSKSSQYRTYAPEMREELENIFKGLETGSIKAIGDRPPKGPANPEGPSHFIRPTQGGLLTPASHLTRNYLTDNWIYTPDEVSQTDLFNDLDFTAVTPQALTSQLCRRCCGLPLWSTECSFVDSQSGLDTKARYDKCKLCQLLSYCIRSRSYSLKDEVQFVRIGSYLTIDDGKEQPVVNLCTLPGPKTKPIQTIQTGFSKLPDAGSEAHFKILREWIRSCDKSHDCFSQQLDFIPTRLLDISELNSDLVRLVEDNGKLRQSKKYAALSHRWGDPNQYVKFYTTAANVKALKGGFKVSSLPRTFRDAVHVARGLGLDYLWIDSVCIIQDDAADWDIESKRMEKVFSSAYCTLAASCASGMNDGFLKTRPERRCIPMMFEDATYYACETIDDFSAQVDQSELNQRGWVMQERALSRRTIYFVENQSYWECGCGVRCETMTKMRNRKASFLSDAHFPQSAEQYVKGLKIEFFQDIYVRYSNLALSFASDRPVAIKGLETRLLNTFNTTGGYGIFDVYLHRSLLWKRDGGVLKRIKFTRGDPVPTWSWMAYDGPIRYVSVPGGKVTWFDDIKSPFSRGLYDTNCEYYGKVPALEAPVWGIIYDPAEESIFLDRADQRLTQPTACVVLGKSSSEPPGEFQTHWVILVHCISKNANGVGFQVYERLGVAVLEKRHINFQGGAREGRIE